ncbi:MAG: deoxyguanosinetriphosphate triphosphohydrolase [Nocardioidaceae bacterium]
MIPGYDEAAAERYVDEPNRSGRSPYQRDSARIVHSAALRRLAGKTQVVGPASSDFIRNRLTHTLEVAQVGRELARTLGCDPDIVEAACLAHDLGHPPFGHNGERALNDAASQIGGFEGNAQTFRLLTRLEAKSFQPSGESVGLNLTRATLDAASKYPWQLSGATAPRGRHGDGLPRAVQKFGVYADDIAVFTWMRAEAEPRRTCVEAQVMDFADDVAYSVHDVEDGVVAERIELTRLADPRLRKEVWETTRDWYAPTLTLDEFDEALGRLSGMAAWPTSPYDGSRRHLGGLKNLTSRLINRFCLGVRDAVAASGLLGGLSRYRGTLPIPRSTTHEIVALKGIAAQLVMRAEGRVELMNQQRELLCDLVDGIWRTGPSALEPVFRHDFETASDDVQRLRVVIDQVASLTDPSAVEKHRIVCHPTA